MNREDWEREAEKSARVVGRRQQSDPRWRPAEHFEARARKMSRKLIGGKWRARNAAIIAEGVRAQEKRGKSS